MVLKALVVDDDELILQTIVDLFEVNNIKVVGTAENGKEAVEKFESLKPDVVFLDMMMPEFDGAYGLEHIRKIDSEANVVIISGAGHAEMDRINEFNPSAVIHKPFKMSTILHTLKEKLYLKV